MLLVFSLIQSKQLHYLMPALPAVALILARLGALERMRAPLAALVPALLGLGLIGAGLGWGPEADLMRVATPAVAFLLCGGVMLGLALAALRLGGRGIAMLGLGVVAAVDLVFALGGPGTVYSSAAMARAIAPSDRAGIGVVDGSYAGQFSFAARLTQPVIELDEAAAGAAWLEGGEGRVLICRLDRVCPAGDPAQTLFWRDHDYGLWRSQT